MDVPSVETLTAIISVYVMVTHAGFTLLIFQLGAINEGVTFGPAAIAKAYINSCFVVSNDLYSFALCMNHI